MSGSTIDPERATYAPRAGRVHGVFQPLASPPVGRANGRRAPDQHEAHYTKRGSGVPPFAPWMLVCVQLYAYANGQRSSRKIERLCERVAGFRMIVGSEVPDHSVIARFCKRVDGTANRRGLRLGS